MNQEFEKKIEVDTSKDIISDNLKKEINIDDINIIMNAILTTCTFLRIENIKDIRFLPSEQGYTIEVSNGNKKLYMEISEFGYVEIVRENSVDGKIVYMSDDNYDISKDNITINDNTYSTDQKSLTDSSGNDFIKKYKIDDNGHEYEETSEIKLEKCPNCNENLLIMDDNRAILTCPKCKTKYISFGGKIYPADKMTNQDVQSLIDDIGSKITELELEKNKIDQEMENNFEEVSKYSVLNKTLEELLSAKKKFINDWDVLLFNTTDDNWIMKSATYRVHIVIIIDIILKSVDDNISRQQLQLLDSIAKYFGNEDKASVIKIVKQLKELESK